MVWIHVEQVIGALKQTYAIHQNTRPVAAPTTKNLTSVSLIKLRVRQLFTSVPNTFASPQIYKLSK